MPERTQDEDRSQRVEGAYFRASSADVKTFFAFTLWWKGEN